MPPSRRAETLGSATEDCRSRLEAVHRAREVALGECRRVVQLSSRSIRALHRRDARGSARLAKQAEAALRKAQTSLRPHPEIPQAGFLHDAEKEFVEARLTGALVGDEDVVGPAELDVGVAAWLNGLAEAASELRRRLLDEMREGNVGRGEELLAAMEDAYDVLVTVDYPDSITGGLRRTTDSLRAVLERSRADVTTAVLQLRLQRSVEQAGGKGEVRTPG